MPGAAARAQAVALAAACSRRERGEHPQRLPGASQLRAHPQPTPGGEGSIVYKAYISMYRLFSSSSHGILKGI